MYINKETGVGKEEKQNVEFAHKKVSWTITMVLLDKCINVCITAVRRHCTDWYEI